MIQKVNSLSSNVYTSHGEILKVFFFFFKYVDLPNILSKYKITIEYLSIAVAIVTDSIFFVLFLTFYLR